MDTPVLRIVTSPLLIQAASLASRRWGPAVGGWLVGLPLTSGPIAFFLALDQGKAFAATAAAGSLAAIAAQAGFCAAYRLAARRSSWPASFSAGTGVFAIAVTLLETVWMPLWALVLMVEAALAIALALAPRLPADRASVPVPPRWDLPARMLVATALVLALTSAAPLLGARLAGMLATFPVFATVLTVFAHRAQGERAAQRVLRGLLLGLFAYSGFFLVIALGLERIGIAASFAIASLVAGVVQFLTLSIIRGSPASGRRQIGCG
jgi:hypothetical protein